MVKKLYSFLFLSCLIFAEHNSFAADYQKKYRKPSKYDVEQGNICPCHETRWFTGLQAYCSFNTIVNSGGAEIDMARFLNPNVNSFYKASRENAEAAEKTRKKIPNYYSECFKNNPNAILHLGFNTGVGYRGGGAIDGYGLAASLGYMEIVNLKLKPDSDRVMMNDLTQRGMVRRDIKNTQQMRDKLDQIEVPPNDVDGTFYKLPETIKCTIWSSDILFEFYHCFWGNLFQTEELHRKEFCLIGCTGVGARINFWEKVSDNIYTEAPKKNKKFVEDNLLRFVPITKFGLQALFTSGIFLEVSLFLQALTIPGIWKLPIPCPTFAKFQDRFKGDDLKFMLAANPEASLRFGYDFYGLCVGEKLEEYYDN
ncbi:MAG: hypothetical protein LBD32_01510 [Cytophagales bacterium]|jgi:hypothetical protein|nr:hypothetical protein [Cytophagales bacterium]